MVINAPIPRAINLGFLGPVPTMLIAFYLLKPPLALTAVFSGVVRNVNGIGLHCQPENVAFTIDSHILAISL